MILEELRLTGQSVPASLVRLYQGSRLYPVERNLALGALPMGYDAFGYPPDNGGLYDGCVDQSMDYASYPNPALRRAFESRFRRRSPSSTVVAAAWVSDRSLCLDVRFSCAVAWAWALLRFSPSRSLNLRSLNSSS